MIQYYKNSSGSELVRLSPTDDNLLKKEGSYDLDGFITCKFSRPKQSNNKLVTDLSKPHYVYIERGSLGN